MKSFKKPSFYYCRPESESDLSSLAEQLLIKAGATGVLPTPIDDLIKVASITEINNIDDLNKSFLYSLKSNLRDMFQGIMQKIRGVADLRERVIYIPKTENPKRSTFPKAHELGHQVILWHKIDPSYLDDEKTLSPDVQFIFEQEANFFASEIIFQGKRFGKEVRDYAATFDSIFKLSDRYGASIQSTLWRYAEEQDESIAVAQYYPSKYAFDESGNPILDHWKTIFSDKFRKKCGNVKLPIRIGTGHPWVAARDLKIVCDGKELINCGGSSHSFDWFSWWNNYALFVLLRRKPVLRVISKRYK